MIYRFLEFLEWASDKSLPMIHLILYKLQSLAQVGAIDSPTSTLRVKCIF